MSDLDYVADPLLLVLGDTWSPLELYLRYGPFGLSLGIYKITKSSMSVAYWKNTQNLFNMHVYIFGLT